MLKASFAHGLMAMAVTAMVLAPQFEAQANVAEARANARVAVKAFNDNNVILVDQASGVVRKRGFGDYTTFLSAGLNYVIFTSGDNGVKDIGLTLWGPRRSNGRFTLQAKKGISRSSGTKQFRVLGFKPKTSGLYLIRVHLIDTPNEGAHVFTLIGLGT